MAGIVKLLIAFALLQPLSSAAQAKFFRDGVSFDYRKLANGDSFSVECQSDQTGVTDRESVDVDATTITIEIPGSSPVVHKILDSIMIPDRATDRFGHSAVEDEVGAVFWAKADANGVHHDGLWLGPVTNGKNISDHAGSSWSCTFPSYQ